MRNIFTLPLHKNNKSIFTKHSIARSMIMPLPINPLREKREHIVLQQYNTKSLVLFMVP